MADVDSGSSDEELLFPSNSYFYGRVGSVLGRPGIRRGRRGLIGASSSTQSAGVLISPSPPLRFFFMEDHDIY